MSTGTDKDYWRARALPGVLKHRLLSGLSRRGHQRTPSLHRTPTPDPPQRGIPHPHRRGMAGVPRSLRTPARRPWRLRPSLWNRLRSRAQLFNRTDLEAASSHRCRCRCPLTEGDHRDSRADLRCGVARAFRAGGGHGQAETGLRVADVLRLPRRAAGGRARRCAVVRPSSIRRPRSFLGGPARGRPRATR
jgi:hypothetical protein